MSMLTKDTSGEAGLPPELGWAGLGGDDSLPGRRRRGQLLWRRPRLT
jgi:hypothetical protein